MFSPRHSFAALAVLLSFLILVAMPRAAAAQEMLVVDSSYAPSVTGGSVWATVLQADGKLLIGGAFTSVNGTSRPHLARLNGDGTLDTDFASVLAINGAVYSIVPLANGQVLIGGDFTQVGTYVRRGIARLNANGSVDTGFTTPTMTADVNNRRVFLLLRLSIGANAGKILVAGYFENIGDSSPARARIARLNANGTLDTTFAPVGFDPGTSIWTMLEQSSGDIVIGGYFASVGGQVHHSLARLSSAGVVDTHFNIGVTGGPSVVTGIVPQADGAFLAVGSFTSARDNAGTSVAVNYIVRFNADLSVDAEFLGGTNSGIHRVEVQPDGKLLIGGAFTSAHDLIGGMARSKLARLTPESGFPEPGFDLNLLPEDGRQEAQA